MIEEDDPYRPLGAEIICHNTSDEKLAARASNPYIYGLLPI